MWGDGETILFIFLGIQIISTPVKKGRKIIGFHFDCIDSTKLAKVGDTNYLYIEDQHLEKGSKEVNTSDIQMDAIKIIAKNPIRYAELLEEEKNNPNIFGFSPEIQAVIRLRDELQAADSDNSNSNINIESEPLS